MKEAADYLSYVHKFKLVKFANVRFDTQQADEISFHDDPQALNQSIYSHMPNQNLAFADTATGSDVLQVLELKGPRRLKFSYQPDPVQPDP